MRRLTFVAAATLLVVVQAARAADSTEPSQGKSQPIGLARMISSIPPGQPWATFQRKGMFPVECATPNGLTTLTWQPTAAGIDRKSLLPIFAAELKAAGFTPADDPDNLFQKDRGEADIQVAGNLKSIRASLCTGFQKQPFSITIGAPKQQMAPTPAPKPDIDGTYGDITLDISWQIHSASADKVIATVDIHSTYSTTGHSPGGYARLTQGGIRENIKQLIASPDFRAAAITAPTAAAFQVADQQPKIVLASSTLRPGKISDAVGSVVLIMSSGGHGSGFLVSSDGYVLTAAHVPGGDKFVKVRWSDGLEGVGEVIRSNRRRDVALIKVEPRGRQPLALNRNAPQAGDTVFAIGAPIDPKLQNTVTRGVVSANRIMDGFSFIQSDVTVDPGNSGGPLLNEKSEVLGFTDIGLRTKDAPTGLNFFVPIDDALRFLSLEPG